jgi:hypothetical protein
MRVLAFWRSLILVGTLFCVVMLFAPLIHQMLARLAETANGLP